MSFVCPGDQFHQRRVQNEHADHRHLPERRVFLKGRRTAGSLLRRKKTLFMFYKPGQTPVSTNKGLFLVFQFDECMLSRILTLDLQPYPVVEEESEKQAETETRRPV